jgi:hypothetical protein
MMHVLNVDDFKQAFPRSFFELVAERCISNEDYGHMISLMYSAFEDGQALTPWEAIEYIRELHEYKSTINN